MRQMRHHVLPPKGESLVVHEGDATARDTTMPLSNIVTLQDHLWHSRATATSIEAPAMISTHELVAKHHALAEFARDCRVHRLGCTQRY
jgi:hypothetical protein